MHPLLIALVVSFGINILMFIPAFIFKTDKLTDISYAATFATIALYGLLTRELTTPNIILAVLVLLWAARLGTYLLIRIWKTGRDKRFDGMRESFSRFLRFWLLQALTVWVVMIPSSLFLASKNATSPRLMIVGAVLFGLGLLTEAVADWQKYTFINNGKNKGKWIESGFWKFSRHPNYFGEICVWTGIYIFTLSRLAGADMIVGLLSPLFITTLLLFVSGIPLLEKAADKRWGGNKQYLTYKHKTSILIPLPPRR